MQAARGEQQRPSSERVTTDPPNLVTVPGGRMSEREAEQAALDLVRAMGEGDIVEGLGKLEMLQVLDDMRCDWMEILQYGLPELTPRQASDREPHLVSIKRVENEISPVKPSQRSLSPHATKGHFTLTQRGSRPRGGG
jgi:hypothetical protein